MSDILPSPPPQHEARPRQHSVRTYLVALVLACLLPGVLGAGALFLYQYREGRAQLELNTLHTARALVQAIDNHLFKVEAIAQALAASETLKSRNFAAFHRKAQEVIAISGLTSSMVLWDRRGNRLIDTSVEYGDPLPNLDHSSHVDHVFETGRSQISDVFTGGASGQPLISVTAPVQIDNQVRYALSLSVSPQHLSDILLVQGLPPGWVAAALDPQGIIYGRNTEFERFVGIRATPDLYESLTGAGEAVLEDYTEEGIPVVTFHSRSPLTGWSVSIGIPRESLEAGLIRRLSLLAASMAVLFGVGFLLAWFMGGRIAAAMRALTDAATALGRGEPAATMRTDIREAAEVGGAIQSASALLAARSAALKAREAELQEAHQLGKFGTWYWDIGSNELHASESLAWIYGRAVPAFPEQRGTLLTEESWDRANAAMQEAIKTGKGYDLELQVNHGEGYSIWVSAKSEVVHDDNGEVVGLLGTIQDITERKHYEDALRESETAAHNAAYVAEAERRRLAAVLEATPVGVIVGDAQGAIVESNAATKHLWGENHPAPHNIEAYGEWKGWWADGSERHGQPLQPQDWPMARALRGEDATRDIIEIAPFTHPQERRIVMMSGAVIRDAQGNILGGVIAQMDITDRIRTEEALREAGRRKDEFLAMLAHELRNPLAPISAAADLLQMKTKNKEQDASRLAQASAIIARQVRHMTSLIDDLLDVSRVTRGLISLDRKPTDLNCILSDAVEQVRPLIEARHHELIVDALPEPALVLGDHNRLVQTVANLLNNAAKFTPERGRISVCIQAQGNCLRIEVADNGTGMPPEVLRRAFDMFAQGERTPDRSQGGLGIGLALVKSLVELHGGEVAAFSEGPGKGSRFSVLLPRYLGEQDKVESEPSAQGSKPELKSESPACALKVMVVDDNVDAARTLAELVEALGHQVVVEHDARAALARSHKEAAQVYLLDIGLPGMDGRELARCLRSQPETANALLVAVTGYAQDRNSFAENDFDHHFTKPVESARLIEILGCDVKLR